MGKHPGLAHHHTGYTNFFCVRLEKVKVYAKLVLFVIKVIFFVHLCEKYEILIFFKILCDLKVDR